MKKILFLLVVVSITSTLMYGQDSMFKKGDKDLNIGIGLGSTLYTGSLYKASVPPVSASFEVGIKDNVLTKGSIGIGGYLGYTAYKWTYLDWGYKYSSFIIGPRGVFHYPLVKKLDTYTGIFLGYNIISSKEFGVSNGYPYNASGGTVAWSWFIGARYYLKDKFGFMAELGYGISWINLGITLKL